MNVGCCINYCDIGTFNAVDDFDFIEVRFLELAQIGNLRNLPKIFAVNNLYPRDKNIFEEELENTYEYFDNVFKTLATYQVKLVTFGSGKARIFNDFNNLTSNFSKWCNILKYLEAKSIETGISVGIEPLNNDETNFIKKVEDAVFYINLLGLKNVGITLDSYHFFSENDSVQAVKDNISKIKHFHIASDTRSFPTSLPKQAGKLLETIISCGYKGNVSVEIDWREKPINDSKFINIVRKLYEK